MALPTGHTVDHYRVLETLGEGSFGVVYKVQDVRDGRIYAMKVVKPAAGAKPWDPIAEARPLVAVQHPYVVSFRALHPMRDGSLAILMDYAPGESLDKFYLKRNNVRELLLLLNQAAMGLDFAHSKGVIHRDVKPANILVTTRDGEPCALVSDFGLGWETGYVLHEAEQKGGGTRPFMAPELYKDPSLLSASIDRWALTVSAFLLLALDYPFDITQTGSRAGRPVFSRPHDIREFWPDFPQATSVAFRKALRAKPQERYGTCLEFTQALGASLGQRLPIEPGAAAVPTPRVEEIVPDLPPIPKELQRAGDPTFDYAVAELVSILRRDLPNNRENSVKIAEVPARWRVRNGAIIVTLPARSAAGRVGRSDRLTALGFATPSARQRDFTLQVPMGLNTRDVAQRVLLGVIHGYGRSIPDVANSM